MSLQLVLQEPAAWGAQLNYGPADRELTSLREFKNLLGMRPELYDRLTPVVTLHSRQRGFDPDLAPQALLALLSNPGGREREQLPDFQYYQYRSRRRSFRLATTVRRLPSLYSPANI